MKTEFEKNLDFIEKHEMCLAKAHFINDVFYSRIKLTELKTKKFCWDLIICNGKTEEKITKKIETHTNNFPIEFIQNNSSISNLSHWKISDLIYKNFIINLIDPFSNRISIKPYEKSKYFEFFIHHKNSFEDSVVASKEICDEWFKLTQKVRSYKFVFCNSLFNKGE